MSSVIGFSRQLAKLSLEPLISPQWREGADNAKGYVGIVLKERECCNGRNDFEEDSGGEPSSIQGFDPPLATPAVYAATYPPAPPLSLTSLLRKREE